MAMPLAVALARRMEGRGESPADLRQVAMVGLVCAVDRFDRDYPNGFIPFAVATILGELKRHMRDRTWALRVPRPVKERSLLIRGAIERLERDNLSITVSALEGETGLDRDGILDALECWQSRFAMSLDAPLTRRSGENDDTLADTLGSSDVEFETVVDREMVGRILAGLAERDRRLLELRFGEELSQREIGERLGISQMHVSRLLRSVCRKLREEVVLEDHI